MDRLVERASRRSVARWQVQCESVTASIETVQLEDSPDVLCCMTELAACNTGTEIELTDCDAVVLDTIREVVITLGHGTHKDSDALVFAETCNISADTYNFRVKAECDFTTIRRQMVGDGVLDNLDELLLRRR